MSPSVKAFLVFAFFIGLAEFVPVSKISLDVGGY